MKILHIIFAFNTGGAETMLVDILNEQSKTEQVELMIVNNLYSENLLATIDKKVRINFIDRAEGSVNPYKILKLNYLLYKLKPDVLHCHNHNLRDLIWFKGSASLCLTIHDVNIPIKNFFRYDKLFAISEAVSRNIAERGGPSSIKIYNGVNIRSIKGKESKSKSEIFKIVQVSRLDHYKKGQDKILNAVHYLKNEKGLKAIQVDFIGEGPSLNYLKELTQHLCLEQNVNFLGAQSRHLIYNNLCKYDLLVQPSNYEGFGLTVVEGMAAKIPVLVSNIDGPMEIIQSGRFGFWFESHDNLGLANCIERIFNNRGSKELHELINQAYLYIKAMFDICTVARKYIDHY